MTATLTQWAIRHGVSHQALAELRQMMGVDTDPASCNAKPGSEAAVQQAIRLEASRLGMRLFRQPRDGDWDTVVANVAQALPSHLTQAGAAA